MSHKFQRILVIEDDAALRSAMLRSVAAWEGAELLEAGTAEEARALLSPPPDLIITDVRLPDDSLLPLLDAIHEVSPAPVVVAVSGKASPDEAFRLAQRGVRAYLPKPFSIQELTATIEMACNDPPNLEPLITASVGRIPMRDLQDEVRRVMLKEALARAEGSRSAAARLLQVTRQAVQQFVNSDEKPLAKPRPVRPSPKSSTV